MLVILFLLEFFVFTRQTFTEMVRVVSVADHAPVDMASDTEHHEDSGDGDDDDDDDETD